MIECEYFDKFETKLDTEIHCDHGKRESTTRNNLNLELFNFFGMSNLHKMTICTVKIYPSDLINKI